MSAAPGQIYQTIEKTRSDALELPCIHHHHGKFNKVSLRPVRREARHANDLGGIAADGDEGFMPIVADVQEPLYLPTRGRHTSGCSIGRRRPVDRLL